MKERRSNWAKITSQWGKEQGAPAALNHKLQLATLTLILLPISQASYGHGPISFLLLASEACSKGFYTWPILTRVCCLTGWIHACLQAPSLSKSEHLWAGKLWELISEAACGLTTQVLKTNSVLVKHATWSASGAEALFLCTKWEQHREWRSWFSWNHSHKLAGAKKRAHTFWGRGLCSLWYPFNLWFYCWNCQQSGNEGKVGHVECQLWWCNPKIHSFSARKKKKAMA